MNFKLISCMKLNPSLNSKDLSRSTLPVQIKRKSRSARKFDPVEPQPGCNDRGQQLVICDSNSH